MTDPKINDVIVFLRTFYEADCAFGVGNCVYEWLNDTELPTLASYNVTYDNSINDYVLQLFGYGFPTDPS